MEIIIRKKADIKSRQWWLAVNKKLRKIIGLNLPKSKLNIFKNKSLTLLLTRDDEIKKLSKRFRKINKPTDVLSFHLPRKEQVLKKYLGDIVISTQKACKNADKKNITIEEELIILLIHAYLHLIGYDHKTKSEAKKMFRLQNHILKSISL